MITVERLKQLIAQGATIYENKEEHILEIGFDNANIRLGYKVSGIYLTFGIQNPTIIAKLENLFETKEEAEEYLEFGNITITKTLKLPNWEEVQKKLKLGGTWNIKFYSKNELDECCLSINAFNNTVIVLGYKCWELTKENYNEARRLCKKLFLGE